MFRNKRKKIQHKPIMPEVVIARPTFAGSDANTKVTAIRAYGFTAGASFGAVLGGAVGTGIAAAGFGLPAPITIPVGIAVGASIGATIGVSIGRAIGKKLESNAVGEQKIKLGEQAHDLLAHTLVKTAVMEELDRMRYFIPLFYEAKIVNNTNYNFFDLVDKAILTPIQKKIYNTILDEHILKQQILKNDNLLEWKDSSKAANFYNGTQIQLLQMRMKIENFTMLYIYEKKHLLLSPIINENDFRTMHSATTTLTHRSNPLNQLLIHMIWGGQRRFDEKHSTNIKKQYPMLNDILKAKPALEHYSNNLSSSIDEELENEINEEIYWHNAHQRKLSG